MPNAPSPSKLTTLEIALIAVGAILLVLLIVGGVIYAKKRNDRGDNKTLNRGDKEDLEAEADFQRYAAIARKKQPTKRELNL